MEPFQVLIVSHSFGSCGKEVFDQLEQAGIRYTQIHSKEILREDELTSLIAPYDGVIVGADIVSRRVIEAGSRLKIIAKHGVGLDNIDLQAAKEHGVAVTFAKNSNSVAVAELAIGMIFALARNLVESTQEIRQKQWIRRKGLELSGATLGVIGTGNIGKEVIARMAPMCKEILAYDAFPDEAFAQQHRVRYVPLQELLSSSDVVTLHVPLLDETRGMICKKTLAWMKPTAILINAARGEIVNEDDICDALENEQLGGYGVDAFAHEPPWDSRLLQMKQVVMTPHTGAYTHEAIHKMSQYSAQSVIAFARGEAVPNRVV